LAPGIDKPGAIDNIGFFPANFTFFSGIDLKIIGFSEWLSVCSGSLPLTRPAVFI
jgi:hypothetical protein